MTAERIAAIAAAHVPIEQEGVKGCRHPTNGGWYWWAECDTAILARLREVEQDNERWEVLYRTDLHDMQQQRDAARADSERLAEALREMIAEMPAFGVLLEHDDIRAALAAHDEATK